MVDDTFYMNLCLQKAWKNQGLTYPNPSVGALILDRHGKLLSLGATQSAGSSHAELYAIEKALIKLGDTKLSAIQNANEKHAYILKNHNNLLNGATIYVTLEPCNHHGKTPPCSLLVKQLGFSKIVIGTKDPTTKATGGASLLKESGMEVVEGILENRCKEILFAFDKWQQKQPYIFFKLAMSQNGVYTGGVISSKESRTHVHQLRAKTDLLIIGGNTVRVDSPTLDCRLSGGKAPDVLIYSHNDNFDREIPLFKIKDRTVTISNNFDSIENYNFIMIEGGEGMLKASESIIDDILLFRASDFKKGNTIQLDMKLKKLHNFQNNSDTIEWFRKV